MVGTLHCLPKWSVQKSYMACFLGSASPSPVRGRGDYSVGTSSRTSILSGSTSTTCFACLLTISALAPLRSGSEAAKAAIDHTDRGHDHDPDPDRDHDHDSDHDRDPDPAPDRDHDHDPDRDRDRDHDRDHDRDRDRDPDPDPDRDHDHDRDTDPDPDPDRDRDQPSANNAWFIFGSGARRQ